MMRVCVFASGSGGNCLLVSEGQDALLIDAGISNRRIEAAVAAAGLTMNDIGGVLITHEHSDHISGLATMLKHRRIPIYAPRTVASHLWRQLPDSDGCLQQIPTETAFPVGGLKVTAFHTPHDTPESVGYRVEGSGVFALATDMGHVTEEIRRGLLGAGTVLIESNHDEQMLSYGPYPVSLKRRILSDRGHLSNAECAKLARELAMNGTRRIILGHLSRENNTPEKAMAESRAALAGLTAELYCAPVSGCLELPVERSAPCFL